MVKASIFKNLALSVTGLAVLLSVSSLAHATGGNNTPPTPTVIPTIFGRDCSLTIEVTRNLKQRKVRRWSRKLLISRGYQVRDAGTPVSETEFSFHVVYQVFDLSGGTGGKITANLTHAEAPTPDKVVPFFREAATPGGLINWFSKSRVQKLIEEVPQCIVIPSGTTPTQQTGGVVIGKPSTEQPYYEENDYEWDEEDDYIEN